MQPLPDPMDAGWEGEGSASLTDRKKKTSIVGIILLFTILAGDLITGAVSSRAGGGSPVNAKQSGTFTATWSTSTTYFVTGTVTFSPAFTAVPRIIVTPRTIPNVQISVTAGHTDFFAVESAGITWLNMPAATTEIFGDAGQHEVAFNFASATMVSWCVNVLTISNSATATLRPQYSLDSVNWFELASVSTTLDINIGGATGVNCNSGSGNIPNAVASPVKGVSYVLLRIVGFNGGGLGDSPVFSIGDMIFYTGYQFSPVCGENLTPTATAFTWRCITSVALGSSAPQSLTVEWQAEVK